MRFMLKILVRSNNVDLYKVLAKELANTLERQFSGNAESRAAGMVINTMGWIEGVGYEASELLLNVESFLFYCSYLSPHFSFTQLLQHAIDTFKANVVLVLGQVCSFFPALFFYIFIRPVTYI